MPFKNNISKTIRLAIVSTLFVVATFLVAKQQLLASIMTVSVILPKSGPTLSGDYSGQATLQGVYNSTLDNTSAVSSMMDLGYIDLAFNLIQSGNISVTGNVILSRTLVFSATEGNIAVTGSMNGDKLHLQSGQFKMKMNEARMIGGEQVAPERIVTRQFSLDTEQILNDGATLLGIYRETIWGYAPEPVTVVGKFALERPVFGSSNPTSQRRVFLPLIRR